MEPNWIITLLIGTLLSIPIGILGNILTPKFQVVLDKYSQSSRGRSLTQLKKDHERVKGYHDNPASLQVATNEMLLKAILGLLGAAFVALAFLIMIFSTIRLENLLDQPQIIVSIIMSLVWIISILYLAWAASQVLDLLTDYSRCKKFEEYQRKTLARIQELEAVQKPQ